MSIFRKNANIFNTPEGGYAVRMVNDTGGVSEKGNVIEPSATVDKGASLITDGDVDPVGAVYNSGVPIGGYIWVVVSGIAEVKYGTAVTRATFARAPIVTDGVGAGLAVAEPLPTPPFATDKHFQEIGHPIESIGSPGLAKTILHFN